MNKQMIEELAKQAGLMCLYDYGPEEDPHAMVVGQKDMELFAELLIRECINRIKPSWSSDDVSINMNTLSDFTIAACRTECVAEIKQHFGVKE